MKIVKLSSENVKRLVAVEITPDGSLVTVGGKNGAGKSSVLDSIAYALGGEKLVPTQPIRKGETEAKIVADLGDYIVTRRFYRTATTTCGVCGNPEATPDHTLGTPETHVYVPKTVYGETKSTLTVTNREGARYPSPQVLLDKLYGKLTFDPLAFKNEKPDKQNEILRRLVNLDFTLHNGQRKTAFDNRAMLKKTLAIAEHKLSTLPRHANAPAAPLSMDDVSKAMLQAEELRKLADDADRQLSASLGHVKHLEAQCQTRYLKMEDLQKQLNALQAELVPLEASFQDAEKDAEARKITADAARAVVPDVSVIKTQIDEIQRTNQLVSANQAHDAQKAAVTELASQVVAEDAKIQEIDDQKQRALASATFPVEGLGLTEDGVTFESLPLAEVSSSVQLRVSIAIGLALNPTLKVLLIRNGNLLDDDGLALVAKQAEDAGAQVWMEYVTSDKGDVSVMLEDGHLA